MKKRSMSLLLSLLMLVNILSGWTTALAADTDETATETTGDTEIAETADSTDVTDGTMDTALVEDSTEATPDTVGTEAVPTTMLTAGETLAIGMISSTDGTYYSLEHYGVDGNDICMWWNTISTTGSYTDNNSTWYMEEVEEGLYRITYFYSVADWGYGCLTAQDAATVRAQGIDVEDGNDAQLWSAVLDESTSEPYDVKLVNKAYNTQLTYSKPVVSDGTTGLALAETGDTWLVCDLEKTVANTALTYVTWESSEESDPEPAPEMVTVAVDPTDGTVANDPTYDGPQVIKVRLLEEGTESGRFLEVYWDRYVDETQAVNVQNFTLKNGDQKIQLEPKGTNSTNTLYFDHENKEVAATDGNCMARLDPELHMSSIYCLNTFEEIDPAGLTLEVMGYRIQDNDGKTAKTAVYTGIPQVSYYTKHIYSEKFGIEIKASDEVRDDAMEIAAQMVDIELAKLPEIAEFMVEEWHCSMAVYGSRQNVYLIPEHRSAFRNDMYDVGGYGGTIYDGCVSSVQETNILRIRNNADTWENTAYPNESVLIHEFGHCIKSVGLEQFADKTLMNEYYAAFEHAKENGLWPNTYAISNSDEFFATMCAIWFNVMDDVSTWDDGTRCPLNTREELKAYDPQTYAFFEKILPSDIELPAPWDEHSPDNYTGEKIGDPVDPTADSTVSTSNNFGEDIFLLHTVYAGSLYSVEHYDDFCLWTDYATIENMGTPDASGQNWDWSVEKTEDGYYRFSFNPSGGDADSEGGCLTATSETTATFEGQAIVDGDDAQLWKFEAETSTLSAMDGKLINKKYGTALTYDTPAIAGTKMYLTSKDIARTFLICNTTNSVAYGKKAYVKPDGAGAMDVEAINSQFGTDVFCVSTAIGENGTYYHVEQYTDICLWWNYADFSETLTGPWAWSVTKTDDGYYQIAYENGCLTATSDTTVTAENMTATADNTAQLWRFVSDTTTTDTFDGKLINVKYGTALTYDTATDGASLYLARANDSKNWKICNATQTAAMSEDTAYVMPSDGEWEIVERTDIALFTNTDNGLYSLEHYTNTDNLTINSNYDICIWHDVVNVENDPAAKNWSWRIETTEEGYYRITYDCNYGHGCLTAVDADTVKAIGVSVTDGDLSQMWTLVPDETTDTPYDVKLVNAEYQTELTYHRPTADGAYLTLTESGDSWLLCDVMESRAAGERVYMDFHALETIAVDAETGAVTADETYDGPQVTKVRVLNEGKFLEIYWDRYVDDTAAIDIDNFVLKNGNKVISLEALNPTSTNTMFFDQKNQWIAANVSERDNCMLRLSEDMHMSSIAYIGDLGEIGPEGLTLEIKGSAIQDENGKSAKNAVYTGVPQLSFYTQFLTSETGIIIKADDTVAYSSLEAAAAQVDVELARIETGIAANMAKYGCSLAIYSPHENVYLIPEHRGGFDTTMYDVEGYGGNLYNGCVSSIAERNILRTRNNQEDPALNTAYRDENILIHEFGHCIKSVGIELLEDQTLANEFFDAYENAKENGLWPNTYRIKNADEFFATMCTVWFNVMDEVDNWNDGTRCPLNTREELKKYDPQTYAFFAKILPDTTLPAPWDEAAPDIYHDEYIDPNVGADEVEAVDTNFETDVFMLQTKYRGDTKEVDRWAPDETKPEEDLCLWWQWGTDNDKDNNWAWQIVQTADGYYRFISYDTFESMTATSATAVGVTGYAPSDTDTAQQWKFVEDTSTTSKYDGKLINVKYGTELVFDKPASDGSILRLAPSGSGDSWQIRNTTQSAIVGMKAFLKPDATVTECTHDETKVVNAKAATCTEDGYTGDTVCAICGTVLQTGTVIPAHGHSYELVGAKDPTATQDGYSGDMVCQYCGHVLSVGQILPATGTGTSTGTSTGIVVPVVRPGNSSNTSSSTDTNTPLAVESTSVEGGSISVNYESAHVGDTLTITPAPEEGYVVDTIVVKDAEGNVIPVTAAEDGTYTFVMPDSTVTIEPVFKAADGTSVPEDTTPEDTTPEDTQEPPAVSFTDVAADAYYYEAVQWAVAQGITTGTGIATFSPDSPCSRAQTVTFLWRAAGSPTPAGTNNPFTDVAPSAYYYNAVLWAVEQGITTGTSANTFSPEATVTRGQVVTFLYRAAGSPAVTAGSAFTDVSADAYCADAIQWAASTGVTTGTSTTTFSPNNNCTRGQIVTFLYRAAK